MSSMNQDEVVLCVQARLSENNTVHCVQRYQWRSALAMQVAILWWSLTMFLAW